MVGGFPLLLSAIAWTQPLGILSLTTSNNAATEDTNPAAAAASRIGTATPDSHASPGCAQRTPVPLDTTLNITLGDRRFLLYFPVNYKPSTPSPLVLSYHGGTRVAEFQQALDLLTTTYFNQDYIIVYPNGIDKTWEGVPNVSTDDRAFTTAILDTLEAQYCVDTTRIFATGKSQGGGFAAVLACDPTLSQRIAAFASVSGSYYQPLPPDETVCDPETIPVACNPGRANVPIITFHGLADDTIAYGGGARRGACLPAIPYYCRLWAERNELPLVNVSSAVPGALDDDDDDDAAVRFEWGGGLVTHVMDGPNIGHDWPSTEPNADNLTPGRGPSSFNASRVMLDFFAAHPLR